MPRKSMLRHDVWVSILASRVLQALLRKPWRRFAVAHHFANARDHGASHRGLTPRVGLEPTTLRLTAECSTIELSRIIKQYSLTNSDLGNSPQSSTIELSRIIKQYLIEKTVFILKGIPSKQHTKD